MKKIMMISDHASPLVALGGVDRGGQNVYVKCLAEGLARRGLYVDVYTRRDNPDLADIVRPAPGVRVLHVPAGPRHYLPKEKLLPYVPEFSRYCSALARQQHYDLVHANFFMSGLVACDLQKRLGLPFVVTFHALGKVRRLHQAGADGFPDERFAFEEKIMARADGIVAECTQDAQDHRQFYGADPGRMTIIPCGVNLKLFYPEPKFKARALLGLPASAPVLLQLGRLVPRKGIDNVIEALSLLSSNRRFRSAILVVVGGETTRPDPQGSPEIKRLVKLAENLKVRDQVRFVGQRSPDQLRWFYSAADIFVTTPWYEPFGITPLEAMACGTPVIGSRVGGIKETVVEGGTGILVPPHDPLALAQSIRVLLNNPELLQMFSVNGLQRARELFTWDQVAAKMHAFYQKVVPEQRAHRDVSVTQSPW